MNEFFVHVFSNIGSHLVAMGLLAGVSAIVLWRKRRVDLWMGLSYSDSETFLKKCKADATAFFTGKAVPALDDGFLEEAGGLLDGAVWKSSLKRSLETLRQVESRSIKGKRPRVHFVLGTLSLWSFVLGTLLKNRHSLVLYHFQADDSEVSYHRIWQMDRTIKNLQAPRVGRVFEPVCFHEVAPEAPLKPLPMGGVEHECLVIEAGSHRIIDSVHEFRRNQLPGASVRVLNRLRDLIPTEPKMWQHAAAEIAHAIGDQTVSSAKETYLFWDGPSVLALMAGDAIGDYAPRKIILMQWDKLKRTYVPVLILPDRDLSAVAG